MPTIGQSEVRCDALSPKLQGATDAQSSKARPPEETLSQASPTEVSTATCHMNAQNAKLTEAEAVAAQSDEWHLVGALYGREGADDLILHVTAPGGPRLDWALRQDGGEAVASGRVVLVDDAMEQADKALAALNDASTA